MLLIFLLLSADSKSSIFTRVWIGWVGGGERKGRSCAAARYRSFQLGRTQPIFERWLRYRALLTVKDELLQGEEFFTSFLAHLTPIFLERSQAWVM